MKTEELIKKKNDRNLSNAELAEMLGIDQSTLWRKLNNKNNGFTLKEANELTAALGLSKEEAADIFFSEVLA